ncbi:MAG: hypothetical protein DRI34_08470 [Deltaproteobacteria bacterium]|nr:MAG: hypothetical protein DRI34_08470 [Deltaproteobacteria bacterium]
MRKILFSGVVMLLVAVLVACGEAPIGQPCTFSWPRDDQGAIDCQAYPTCAPLQDTSSSPPTVNNAACPTDCIQLPSLQCENLICVATQIPGDVTHMNGSCSTDLAGGTECTDAPVGCLGYCSKECLSDASCPKGYSCSHMAPFGTNLNCENEADWGTSCTTTSACVEAGASPTGNPEDKCPSSVAGDPNYDYSVCEQGNFARCCACICYRYCPLLSKKFCRKTSWDDSLFPDAETTNSDCSSG